MGGTDETKMIKCFILLIKVGCGKHKRAGVFVSATEMMRSTELDLEWCVDYVRSVRSDAAMFVLLSVIRYIRCCQHDRTVNGGLTKYFWIT